MNLPSPASVLRDPPAAPKQPFLLEEAKGRLEALSPDAGGDVVLVESFSVRDLEEVCAALRAAGWACWCTYPDGGDYMVLDCCPGAVHVDLAASRQWSSWSLLRRALWHLFW